MMKTEMRLEVATVVLASIGLAVLLAQFLLSSETALIRMFGMLFALFLGFFGYEWTHVHSNALTRQRRAHFDEANILETYQPRARTHGHFFQPDPGTPVPKVQIQEEDNKQEQSESERAVFNANRDAHYSNMYQNIMRMNKERDAMEKASSATDSPRQTKPTPNVEPSVRVEFSEPKDKKSDDDEEDF